MDMRLAKTLSEVFGISETKINQSLSKDNFDNWDSLKQMDLVLSIEKEYAIQLTFDDIRKMISVAAIEEVLKQKDIKIEN